MTGKVWKDNLSYAEALELKKDHNVDIHTTLVKKYAKGTRNAKGNLIITDEEGYELKLPKLSEGQYTIANEGTQVLTKAQTDNIFDWSKLNPADFAVPFNMADSMWKDVKMPDFAKNREFEKPLQIGNLIKVEGSIDNSNVKQMESIANKAVTKLVDKLYNGYKYGR